MRIRTEWGTSRSCSTRWANTPRRDYDNQNGIQNNKKINQNINYDDNNIVTRWHDSKDQVIIVADKEPNT